MSIDIESERRLFEAHILSHPSACVSTLNRHPDGGYLLGLVHNCWVAWCARAALAAQQEPVAAIGRDFQLVWFSCESIAHIVRQHSLKIGDRLYAAPPAPAEKDPS